tara:strand:+ start:85 stop:375 length:291 start_codon:yes stop_codon:yes gene_type:complete
MIDYDYDYDYDQIDLLIDELEHITKHPVVTGVKAEKPDIVIVMYFCIYRKKKMRGEFDYRDVTGNLERRQIKSLILALKDCIKEQKNRAESWYLFL